jgi:hypothetical protein
MVEISKSGSERALAGQPARATRPQRRPFWASAPGRRRSLRASRGLERPVRVVFFWSVSGVDDKSPP